MKLFKRAATFCMAAAMALSLSVTAFAAGNGGDRTLTVTGVTLDNKKVYAVQMFDARVKETTGNYTFDSYVLADEDWLTFFKDSTDAGVNLQDKDSDGDVDTDDASAYVESLRDQNLADFANKAQAWVRSHSNDFTVLEVTASNDSATFAELKAGYYLVYPEGGSTGDGSRGTDAMLVNVPLNNNAEWSIKSVFPTVEKKVDDRNTATGSGNADNGSAQVGDVVTFTLTSTVPDMSDYETYVFQFTDKLPEGLTLVNAAEDVLDPVTSFAKTDVTLTIDGKSVKAANFEVSAVILDGSNWSSYEEQGVTGDDVGKTLMTVKITNLAAADLLEGDPEAAATGDQIVLTYMAMINENAVTTDPVTNEASVQYSNDPSNTTLGTSTPDESTVYTYEINVHKWSVENGGEERYLKDAVFALSKESDLGTLSISTAEGVTNGKVVNDKGISVESSLIGLTGSGNTYVINPESAVHTFATTDSGAIKIQGLEAGTYYLYEVTAPASYNKLKDPVAIVIKITDLSTGTATITVNGSSATGSGTTVNVENKKGIELPETGSIGTIGLTVAGVAVVLAGVMLPRKKKNKEQE